MERAELRPVFYDTDIASDVDDALALVYLTNSIQDRIAGVSTVYGPVETRARAAQTLLKHLGANSIPVVAGESIPHSPNVVIWTTGHESYLIDESAQLSEVQLTDLYKINKEFDVLATGPLTNIATMLDDEQIANFCHEIVVMGDSMSPNETGHGVVHKNVGREVAVCKEV